MLLLRQVLDSKYRGKIGTIKHIFRYFVFLQVTDRVENGGIIVVRGNQCCVLGANNSNNEFEAPPMSPGGILREGGAQVLRLYVYISICLCIYISIYIYIYLYIYG